MSHIESLKEAADVTIGITQVVTPAAGGRPSQTLSRVQYGRRGEMAPVPKKIGRPKKVKEAMQCVE